MGQSKISERLLDLSRDKNKFFDFSYIDVEKDGETISFLQSNRIERLKRDEKPYEEYWTSKLRVTQKIGRFLKQVIPSFSDDAIEKFVKKFKSILREEDGSSQFDIVEGNMLVYWYDNRNYETTGGTLGSSIMGKPECSMFLGIYRNNPDVCNLLILKNKEGNKIKGRALVWKLSEPSDKIFMDTVYTNNEDDQSIFVNYANRHGWLYKSDQRYGGTTIDGPNINKKEIDLVVDLDRTNFKSYPYVDTLRYYYPSIKKLSSSDDKFDEPYYTLTDTFGYYEEYKEEGDVYDPLVYDGYNKINIPESTAIWCKYDKGYIRYKDAIRISNNEYSYPNSDKVVFSDYTKKWYPIEECDFSRPLNSWIWNKYSVTVYHDRYKNSPPDFTHRFELNKSIGMVGKDYYDIELLYPVSSKKQYDKESGKWKTVVKYDFKEVNSVIEEEEDDDNDISEGEK